MRKFKRHFRFRTFAKILKIGTNRLIIFPPVRSRASARFLPQGRDRQLTVRRLRAVREPPMGTALAAELSWRGDGCAEVRGALSRLTGRGDGGSFYMGWEGSSRRSRSTATRQRSPRSARPPAGRARRACPVDSAASSRSPTAASSAGAASLYCFAAQTHALMTAPDRLYEFGRRQGGARRAERARREGDRR